MKKIIFTLLAAVMLFSCDTVSQEEKENMRELLSTSFNLVNKMISGQMVDDVTRCDSCVFKDDYVSYFYTIDETILPLSQIRKESSIRKNGIKTTLENNVEMEFMIDMLKKLDGGFNYIYKGSTTGATHTITIDY